MPPSLCPSSLDYSASSNWATSWDAVDCWVILVPSQGWGDSVNKGAPRVWGSNEELWDEPWMRSQSPALGSNPNFATDLLCDLGHVALPL